MARLSATTVELFGKGFAAFSVAGSLPPLLSPENAPALADNFALSAAPANDATQPTIQLTFG